VDRHIFAEHFRIASAAAVEFARRDVQPLGPWDLERAINFLWRTGKVPEWIDVSVVAADEEFSYVECRCCGRFVVTEEYLYHRAAGIPPFHVLSPPLPPDWIDTNSPTRFTLVRCA
jgi:hypothetical protein